MTPTDHRLSAIPFWLWGTVFAGLILILIGFTREIGWASVAGVCLFCFSGISILHRLGED